MSSLHKQLIFEIFKGCGYKTYLELGVYDGTTLSLMSSIAEKAVGVDVKNNLKYAFPLNTNIFWGTTDDFFEQNNQWFDMIFIDACHDYDQVVKDLGNSLLIMNSYGTIVIHDTDPHCKEYLAPNYCSDSWRVIDYIKEHYEGLIDVVTLPFYEEGLTIVKRSVDRRVFSFIGE